MRAAAASDAEVERAYRSFAIEARYEPYRSAGKRLAAMGFLASDFDARSAADVLWTILSPDTYHLFVDERGWATEEFRAWATSALIATLLAKTRRT